MSAYALTLVESPYSYLVDMGDGRVRHVHANKMHKFHARVQGCNVISECDDDIGRVLVPVMCYPVRRLVTVR